MRVSLYRHIKRFAQFIAVCRSHLPDEQGHIVAPLGDDHQVACPKDLLGLWRHLHSHGTLLSQARATWERAYQLHARPQRTGDPKLRPPRKLSFWTFCTAMGRLIVRFHQVLESVTNWQQRGLMVQG